MMHGRRFWPWFALCALLSVVILALMPPEKTIGPVIKLVYLHGALSRAGMIGFWAAGLLAVGYLIRPGAALLRWSQALLLSGWGYWTAHFLVSIPATRLTWGPWVAWGEPRVTMTLQLIVAGLVISVVARLLDHARFAASANLLFAMAVLFLVERTGVLRHPLDPIGESPSATLRLIYALLLAPIMASMFLAAWRLTGMALVQHAATHSKEDPHENR